MRIGGLQKFSLIDYPGKMAAIVFTQGCNFRCGYCHNPQLVCPGQFQVPITESAIFEFLESRRWKLQGVVVTGGEPTIHKDLPDFLVKIKTMKYAVKLDTNGSNPEALAAVIQSGLVDYIAMDIKTSPARYEQAIGVKQDIEAIKSSIQVIRQSGLQHQFRTTLVRAHCSSEDLMEIKNLIGSSVYTLQPFIPLLNIIDTSLLDREQYPVKDVQNLQSMFQAPVASFDAGYPWTNNSFKDDVRRDQSE